MGGLVSGFVWLFALDAAVGVVDSQLALWTGSGPLTILRGLIAAFLLPYALLTFGAVVCTPRPPKRVVLPLVALALWPAFGALPLSIWLGLVGADAVLAVTNALCAGISLLWIRSQTGSFKLTHAWLEERGPGFRALYTCGFAGASLIGVPVVFGAYLWLGVWSALHHFTADFARLHADGLYSVERVYEREDRRVHLIGMVHVGDPEFYAQLSDELPREHAVVLTEGVSDRDERLVRFGYSGVAELFELAEQGSALELGGETGPPVLHADVDTSAFHESTIEVLNSIAGLMNSRSTLEFLNAFAIYQRAAMDPEVQSQIWRDVLELRNEHLIATLEQALGEHATAVVPWGALHLKAVEAALLERGFEPRSESERRAISFR